ncbi:hypothetical protein BTJ39_03685 [Izhakiella australiensis]|uniref:OTU domain-containing protein n=1 Tax=Izhakiella australiensis TaxID=1926881 RepID=A0A1S8YQI1_9GAMM|nr:OTU domain-containing protein [Izhakiella australiensis]OON41082.1 hypothetical protein BTJ39_03685 [Izhakiella australiensis]
MLAPLIRSFSLNDLQPANQAISRDALRQDFPLSGATNSQQKPCNLRELTNSAISKGDMAFRTEFENRAAEAVLGKLVHQHASSAKWLEQKHLNGHAMSVHLIENYLMEINAPAEKIADFNKLKDNWIKTVEKGISQGKNFTTEVYVAGQDKNIIKEYKKTISAIGNFLNSLEGDSKNNKEIITKVSNQIKTQVDGLCRDNYSSQGLKQSPEDYLHNQPLRVSNEHRDLFGSPTADNGYKAIKDLMFAIRSKLNYPTFIRKAMQQPANSPAEPAAPAHNGPFPPSANPASNPFPIAANGYPMSGAPISIQVNPNINPVNNVSVNVPGLAELNKTITDLNERLVSAHGRDLHSTPFSNTQHISVPVNQYDPSGAQRQTERAKAFGDDGSTNNQQHVSGEDEKNAHDGAIPHALPLSVSASPVQPQKTASQHDSLPESTAAAANSGSESPVDLETTPTVALFTRHDIPLNFIGVFREFDQDMHTFNRAAYSHAEADNNLVTGIVRYLAAVCDEKLAAVGIQGRKAQNYLHQMHAEAKSIDADQQVRTDKHNAAEDKALALLQGLSTHPRYRANITSVAGLLSDSHYLSPEMRQKLASLANGAGSPERQSVDANSRQQPQTAATSGVTSGQAKTPGVNGHDRGLNSAGPRGRTLSNESEISDSESEEELEGKSTTDGVSNRQEETPGVNGHDRGLNSAGPRGLTLSNESEISDSESEEELEGKSTTDGVSNRQAKTPVGDEHDRELKGAGPSGRTLSSEVEIEDIGPEYELDDKTTTIASGRNRSIEFASQTETENKSPEILSADEISQIAEKFIRQDGAYDSMGGDMFPLLLASSEAWPANVALKIIDDAQHHLIDNGKQSKEKQQSLWLLRSEEKGLPHYDLIGKNGDIVAISRDGNCFFNACSQGLALSGHHFSTQQLRDMAADELIDNPEQYASFLDVKKVREELRAVTATTQELTASDFPVHRNTFSDEESAVIQEANNTLVNEANVFQQKNANEKPAKLSAKTVVDAFVQQNARLNFRAIKARVDTSYYLKKDKELASAEFIADFVSSLNNNISNTDVREYINGLTKEAKTITEGNTLRYSPQVTQEVVQILKALHDHNKYNDPIKKIILPLLQKSTLVTDLADELKGIIPAHHFSSYQMTHGDQKFTSSVQGLRASNLAGYNNNRGRA